MKGIILAGGSGTRLYPLTLSVSKQLLPVYDKPMIYYPLSLLMLAGIKDILIISTRQDIPCFQKLLGSGKSLGINLNYAIQENPNGLAEAFLIGEDFIDGDKVCMILGDNIFYGQGLVKKLRKAKEIKKGATVFGYWVKNPNCYGVAEIDKECNVLSLEEKPLNPKSNYAVTGLYFYDEQVVSLAKKLQPSSRGELEITDLNKLYLNKHQLNLEILGRGFAWLDTGTHQTLASASQFIETIEERQGLKIACLEEIAFRMGYIDLDQLYNLAKDFGGSSYGDYLRELASQFH